MSNPANVTIRTAPPSAADDHRPDFPTVYAMTVDAPSGRAGPYMHGEHLLFNTIEEPDQGDLVGVHTRQGACVLVVLGLALPPGRWLRVPFRERPDADTHAILLGTILGTERHVQIALQDCLGVHKCDGPLES